MKRAGSDYWPLYHDDFWDSEAVLRMPPATKAAYLFLLGLQAKHGALPVDPKTIAALAAGHFPGFLRWHWPTLEQHFPIDAREGVDLGRRNPRQALETDSIDARRGNDAAKKRAARVAKATCPQDVPPTEERRGEERRPVPTEQEEAPPLATPPSPRAPRVPRAPSGIVQEIIAAWQAEFFVATGETYVMHPGDAPAVAALVKRAGAVTSQDALRRARMLLRAQEAYWITNRNLRTLAARWSDVGSIPAADAARGRARPGTPAGGRVIPTAAETTRYLEEVRATPTPEVRPSLAKLLHERLQDGSR